MRHGKLTREEAVAIVGEQAVQRVENAQCEFTNRVQTGSDKVVEFSAGVKCPDKTGEEVHLSVYYYYLQSEVDAVENLDQLDWKPAGYDVE